MNSCLHIRRTGVVFFSLHPVQEINPALEVIQFPCDPNVKKTFGVSSQFLRLMYIGTLFSRNLLLGATRVRNRISADHQAT
jgi:hypothetical protein